MAGGYGLSPAKQKGEYMKKDKIYIVIIIAAAMILASVVILDNIGMSSEGQKRAVYAKEQSPDYDIAADFADQRALLLRRRAHNTR